MQHTAEYCSFLIEVYSASLENLKDNIGNTPKVVVSALEKRGLLAGESSKSSVIDSGQKSNPSEEDVRKYVAQYAEYLDHQVKKEAAVMAFKLRVTKVVTTMQCAIRCVISQRALQRMKDDIQTLINVAEDSGHGKIVPHLETHLWGYRFKKGGQNVPCKCSYKPTKLHFCAQCTRSFYDSVPRSNTLQWLKNIEHQKFRAEQDPMTMTNFMYRQGFGRMWLGPVEMSWVLLFDMVGVRSPSYEPFCICRFL